MACLCSLKVFMSTTPIQTEENSLDFQKYGIDKQQKESLEVLADSDNPASDLAQEVLALVN